MVEMQIKEGNKLGRVAAGPYKGMVTIISDRYAESATVKEFPDGYPLLSLNGTRSRQLAEELLGAPDEGLLILGTDRTVPVAALRSLPNLDSAQLTFIQEAFKEQYFVNIEVVAVEPRYGVHVHVRIIPDDLDGKIADYRTECARYKKECFRNYMDFLLKAERQYKKVRSDMESWMQ